MKYKNMMLAALLLLAILTMGAVSASEDADTLAVSDDVGDIEVQAPAADEILTENSTFIVGDEGDDEGDDNPYNVEIVGEFDITDRDQEIIKINCPEGTEGYFVIMTLDDDWRELYEYSHHISSDDWGNVIGITPDDLNITEPGGYIIDIYLTDDSESYHDDNLIFEAPWGIEAIDYSQFRYISMDTFEPSALFMDDIFAVYCPVGSSGTVTVDVRKDGDDEFFETSDKEVKDKDEENKLYWNLAELGMYGADGKYFISVYHQGFNDSRHDDIKEDEIDVKSPVSIDSFSYIDSPGRGGFVFAEIPSNFEDGEIWVMIGGELKVNKTLSEFVEGDGNSPYWRYSEGHGGTDESKKWYYINNYHFDYDFEGGQEYVITAILSINQQSGTILFTEESEIRMINRNIVSDDDGHSIEIFGEIGYWFDDWIEMIAITSPEGSDGTVEIWVDDYDEGWRWEGPLDELSDFIEEENQYFIVPGFFEDLESGEHQIFVAYKENGVELIRSSGFIEFYDDGDEEEDGPIDDIELEFNAEDEEELEFEISDNETIAYLLIPDNEEFEGTEVTVTITKNGEDFATFNTEEMDYETDEVKEAKKYPIDLDLTQLNDKDLLSISLDCFDEDWAYVIEIAEDTAIFHMYEGDEVDLYVFIGNITLGDFNDPERMGPHPRGNFIEFSIPGSYDVTEGSIVVSDDIEVIYQKQLNAFVDREFDYSTLGYRYIVSLDEYNLMSLPENRIITFTLNFGSDSLTFKRIRHADYLSQIVTPDDVARVYDVTINEEVMTSEDDTAVSIVGKDANPQTIWIELGEGQFNVYVNDQKVEGLGNLIFENWMNNNGVLDADLEELREMDLPDMEISLEEFAELSRDEKISILKEEFPDDITLFRLTSFRHGCPELQISLADLNITESGEYNIKVTHFPGDPIEVWNPDYPPENSTELVETLVLEKTISVVYKPSPFISAPAVTTQYGTPVNITVNMYAGARGNAWFTVNGKTEKAPISGGVATYTVSDLKYGLYPVEIRYNGNALYAASTINTTLKVNKITQPIVSVSADDIGFNEDATVIVNVAQKVNGNIHITVNNVTKAAPIANGVATATFSGLERGTYEVTALYKGTVNIVSKTKTTTFKVVKGTPIISVDAPDAGYGSDAIITVNMGNRANGNVHVTINGVTERAKITDGVATYAVSGLKRGTYDVTVAYNGNANYNAQEFTTTLNVVKGTPIASVSVDDINVGDDAVVTVNFVNNVNGFVKITVNGVTERVQIVDGVATASFSGLKAGSYDVTVAYAGSTNFNGQTATADFSVSKSSPNLGVGKRTIDGKTVLIAEIAEDATGFVNFAVNGGTYKAKIVNGVATITLPDFAPGTYTLKSSYNGNYKYLAQTKTRTITIK